MGGIYRDAMFVPIGRGYVNLDCYRIYEAVVAGAIPVVVGPKEEILETFAGHRDPPFVFAESWDAAAKLMTPFRHNHTKWQAFARQLAPWWCNWLHSLRLQIGLTLGSK